MRITRLARHTTPVCFLADGRMLCYHRRKLLVLRSGNVEKSISLPVSRKELLFGWSQVLSRLFRFGVRVAEPLDDTHVIICIGNTLYEVDVETGRVTEGWFCGYGIRPLILSSIKDIESFEDGVYFGGYLSNREKKPVCIYHRIGVDRWEIIYTFPQGTINHVHNVVADPYRQCIWLFTGDFDEAAAIWKATDGFKTVECVAFNKQQYRGCVAFSLQEGLLYATDSPYAENYVYLMDTVSFSVRPLFPLDGSCIYGCKWRDKFVFSSTVESDGRKSGVWKLLYQGNRGAGIKDDYAHLYVGNLIGGFDELYKEEKDGLSFLFQFGLFKFPYGENNSNTLYFQPMATTANDMWLMALIDD